MSVGDSDVTNPVSRLMGSEHPAGGRSCLALCTKMHSNFPSVEVPTANTRWSGPRSADKSLKDLSTGN